MTVISTYREEHRLLPQLWLPFNRLHSRILKKSANLVLDSFETDAYFANRRGLRLRTMGRERRTMEEEDGHIRQPAE